MCIYKFVLMQDPVVPDLDHPNAAHYTIGLATLYPNKGFDGCDEYGQTGRRHIALPEKDLTSKYAFLDDESKAQFKGKTEVIKGVTFATVLHHKE